MDNIIECRLNSTCKEIFAGLWQHDYGQILRITGADLPKAVEVQFSLKDKGGDTLTRIGTTVDGATEVKVPDSLLKNENCTQNYLIYAWIYVTDDTSGNTEYKIILHVKSRSKPEKPTEEPLPEPNIFHETVEAVNVSAERAEKAASDAENIRDNLNLDLSEKITRPDTAKVGQVLAVKEIDESGKPTVFEAEDVKVPTKTSELENDSGFLTEHQDISGKLDTEKLPEAIDTALAQAKESGVFDGKDGANGKDGTPGEQGPKGDPGETTYIENPYDDTELKSEIATKITAPENPEVGKVFKIKSVNDDGTFIGEWADCANLDVQIKGKSIVTDGIAEIPIANRDNVFGVVKTVPYEFWGTGVGASSNDGQLRLYPASNGNIDARRKINVSPISVNNLDYAVKAAMCDGKGAAWTDEEQAAARERMGAESSDWEDVITYITSSEEEECTTCYIDFEHTYRKIYVLIDESAIKGTTYMSTRFGVIGKNKLHNTALLTNTSPAFNIKQKYKTFSAEVMNTADTSYRYTASSSLQLYSYCENPFIGRVGTPSITAVDASAIGGITWYGKMYAGTRIVVKGVRA